MNRPLPTATGGSTARHLAGLLRRRVWALSLTVFLLLCGSASGLLIPRGLGWIVDAVLAGEGIGRLVLLVAVIVCAGAVSSILVWWGSRLLVAVLQAVVAELREDVFAAAVQLDAGVVEGAGSSDVVSRITRDVEAVTEAAAGILPRVAQAGFTIAMTAVGLAVLDPWLALAALTAIPVQILTTRRFLRRSRPLYVRLRAEESQRGQAIIEAVTGAATVQAHQRQEDHLSLVGERSLTAVETQREAARVRNGFHAGVNAAEFVGLAAVLAVGFWRADAVGLTVGAVTAAALFYHRLFGPIGALLSSVDDLQRASVGLERLVGVLQVAPGPEDGTEVIAPADVQVRDLWFSYDSGRDVLREIRLHVAAGATAVLVGASGSGKSTLARLIAGALNTSRGEILVGGVPARLARRGGAPAALLVTQETHLFAGSVATNLRLARPNATDDELTEALRTVGAQWAFTLSQGLDTVLDQDLDDARIQQLALARVLLADPPVAILDEATAQGGAEGRLDAAVAAVARGRTTIVVAHRLTQVAHADLVVVLDRGRIEDVGTPTELVRRGGEFARLWAAWHDRPRP